MKICIGNVCEKKSACSDVNSVKERKGEEEILVWPNVEEFSTHLW